LPEIEENKKLASSMQARLTAGQAPSFMLNVAAWQTISGGGLLVGLEPEEINRFLHVYSLVFEINTLCVRLRDLSSGVNSALANSSQTRQFFANELQGKLSDLQKVFAEAN
jgi:hypothetical protein